MVLPILISVSDAPASYFFSAAAKSSPDTSSTADSTTRLVQRNTSLVIIWRSRTKVHSPLFAQLCDFDNKAVKTCAASIERAAAVDVEILPGDVAGLVADQECD